MNFTYTQKVIKTEKECYTVIIPDNTEKFYNGYFIFEADRRGLETVMMSALMMTKIKDALIYFPIKKNIMPSGFCGGAGNTLFEREVTVYDLVFANCDINAAENWNEIIKSAEFSNGARKNFELDVDGFCDAYKNETARNKADNRRIKNCLNGFTSHGTLFIFGDEKFFARIAADINELLKNPLEEKFKNGEMSDFTVLASVCGENRIEQTDLGFFDVGLWE